MKNVLLIDSGSGGINILKECVRQVPNCNYLMFCDNKNLPYGTKTVSQLQAVTLENLASITKFFDFDIVILACNTLTCTCLEKCREVYPDKIFIGTVPAVKPALERFSTQDILVLATPVTIKHNKLINKHPDLVLKSMPTLATEIDAHLDELELLQPLLLQSLQPFRPKAIVLGCTHYTSVSYLLQMQFPHAEIFDSREGVAKRLLHFVGQEEKSYQVQIIVTENPSLLPRFWNYYLSQ
ncbi:MAG: aspartate/glutamate racemase family protein [Clostridia bacterium]|nr:aspartate/glutamate racemase family protein [Clostridia bacterium]